MPGSVPPTSFPPAEAAPPSPVAASGPAHVLRVTLLMAGSCLPILGAVLIAPVLPKMQDHFASVPGAKALVPLALTVPALALALLAPFAGVLVDRLGRKRLLVVAAVLYSVFGTAPLWLHSLGAIIASRALVGVTEAAIMTCCTTLIGDYYSGRQRVRYLALQTMCASASATVFFVVGGAAGSAGWRMPFWVYAVSLVLAPLMAAVLPSPAGRTTSDEVPVPGAAARRAFPWRQLAGICALTFFGAIVFYTVPVEMSYLLDDLGVTNTGVIGLATAVASAATVGGAILFARLKRAPEPVIPAALAVCAGRLRGDVPRGRRAAPGDRRGDQLRRHGHAAARPADERDVPSGLRGPRSRYGPVDGGLLRRRVRLPADPAGGRIGGGQPRGCGGRTGRSHGPGRGRLAGDPKAHGRNAHELRTGTIGLTPARRRAGPSFKGPAEPWA
ncbi:MFS family permease [Streptomyces canus]